MRIIASLLLTTFFCPNAAFADRSCSAALTLRTVGVAVVCVSGFGQNLEGELNGKLVDLAREFKQLRIEGLTTSYNGGSGYTILCASVRLASPSYSDLPNTNDDETPSRKKL